MSTENYPLLKSENFCLTRSFTADKLKENAAGFVGTNYGTSDVKGAKNV